MFWLTLAHRVVALALRPVPIGWWPEAEPEPGKPEPGKPVTYEELAELREELLARGDVLMDQVAAMQREHAAAHGELVEPSPEVREEMSRRD